MESANVLFIFEIVAMNHRNILLASAVIKSFRSIDKLFVLEFKRIKICINITRYRLMKIVLLCQHPLWRPNLKTRYNNRTNASSRTLIYIERIKGASL